MGASSLHGTSMPLVLKRQRSTLRPPHVPFAAPSGAGSEDRRSQWAHWQMELHGTAPPPPTRQLIRLRRAPPLIRGQPHRPLCPRVHQSSPAGETSPRSPGLDVILKDNPKDMLTFRLYWTEAADRFRTPPSV
ncbi:hypothetical protein NDU88_005394 [Pleurodeles waltl]|uniref:Uncharacterized protein n=1 Tax=Pleurodeles waltl TaxID=8319 RepID=A0AAV7LS09_PLEWA|nr:hypothetical protein NDU88_005394 [Pleurodeles waltl]